MLVLFSLAIGALPASVHAQTDFERYLTAVRRLHEAKEYKRALEQIQRIRKVSSNGDEQDAALLLYEGIILADMGQRDESLKAFESALILKPDAQLPFKVSSKMSRDFEAVRARVHKELKSEQWAKPRSPAPEPSAEAAAPGAPSEELKPVASLPELGAEAVSGGTPGRSPQVSPQLFGFVDPLGKSFGAGGGLVVGLRLSTEPV